ncbi:MAG: metalloregulator ArsR/SmtB family transcription factor [bacterium]
MVKRSSNLLDSVFAALADPTRRAILEDLARERLTVTELAEPHDMSLPAVSKHLRVLEDAGLIVREIDGRVHRLELDSRPMKAALAWLEHYRKFWDQKFDALDNFLKTQQKR